MADSKMFRLCPGCTMKSVVLVVEDFLKTTKKMQTQKNGWRQLLDRSRKR